MRLFASALPSLLFSCIFFLPAVVFSAASSGPLSLSEYCSLGIPISTLGLLGEYDVNCGFNASGSLRWTSRWPGGPDVAIPRNYPDVLTFDTVRGLYMLPVNAVNPYRIPIDISPSVLPDVSVELVVMLVSQGSGTARTRHVWSASKVGGFLQPPRFSGRALLGDDKDGTAACFSPMGARPGPQSSCGLFATTNVPLHIVSTFSASTNSSSIYVNGLFSHNRTGAPPPYPEGSGYLDGVYNLTSGSMHTVDGEAFININGIAGDISFSYSAMIVYYVRVWSRILSLAESRALCCGKISGAAGPMAEPQFTQIVRPYFTKQPMTALYVPLVSASPTFWQIGVNTNAINSVKQMLYTANVSYSGSAFSRTGGTFYKENKTTSVTTFQVTGNASYTVMTHISWFPSALYRSKYGHIPDTEINWSDAISSNTTVFRGVSNPGSAISIVALDKFLFGNTSVYGQGSAVTVRYKVTFPSQLKVTASELRALWLAQSYPIYSVAPASPPTFHETASVALFPGTDTTSSPSYGKEFLFSGEVYAYYPSFSHSLRIPSGAPLDVGSTRNCSGNPVGSCDGSFLYTDIYGFPPVPSTSVNYITDVTANAATRVINR